MLLCGALKYGERLISRSYETTQGCPKILPTNWSVDFAMDDEHEKSTVKEATSELANLIATLTLGSEEMPIEEYVQPAKEEVLDA